MANQLGVRITVDTERGASLITQARNHTVRRFLATEASVLFFIDADLSWDAVDFFRVLAGGHDIGAAAYRMKKQDRSTRYTCNPTGEPAKDGWLPCFAAGTGFMAIRRSVFETMKPPVVEDLDGPMSIYFDCSIRGGKYWGEDYSFCMDWVEKHGGRVMVLPDCKMSHWGEYHWTGSLSDKQGE